MNATNLSTRLQRVANYVDQGAIVADIGSDHAYLPCYLVLSNKVTTAFAGEVVLGPFESAMEEVRRNQLEHAITVRLADGLLAVQPEDQVNTVTIAGMGGPLIASILSKGLSRLPSVQKLIVQPNIHAKAIREWAIQNGWKLTAEEILEEDAKIYEILVLKKGVMTLSEKEKWLGPFLLAEKSPAFLTKWNKEKKSLQSILMSVENAEQTTELEIKKKEILQKLQWLKEEL
ncbi:tRNA (adenine(22)-N(1))-methyltransferase [Paenisporosarcina cavernae]|uniref:tRNA (Adenine-N(1))-methyltransferase n=1 Tax=Paenisporosarcina cavernae TaxID=2320858 RepID=A0A385YTG0_9BACL|nr:tRNA (adenine(22)-N(1))-methyltransferase TrmK [Paenisporosarcina cavernae]AYC29600.1 tRNA (adenine-N(1))-methyltransferase [Paenisporosarcina cavernae]